MSVDFKDIAGDGALNGPVPTVDQSATLHFDRPGGMALGFQPPPEPQAREFRAPGKFSPKLVQMLLDLTPAQRDEAAKIAGKLLAIRARKVKAQSPGK